MGSETALARVEAGLRRQEELLRELLSLGERQLDLVRERNLPALEGALARKRELQEALEREQAAIAPLWERLRGRGEEAARSSLGERVAALESLLEKLRRLEEEAARSLGEKLAEVRGELEGLSRGSRALENYAGRRPPPPRFIDTEH